MLRVFTDESQTELKNGQYRVSVIWNAEFNLELLAKQAIKHVGYEPSPENLKKGTGRLHVFIHASLVDSQSKANALAETVAAAHIIDNEGVNLFGFEVETSVIREYVDIYVSQEDAKIMLNFGNEKLEDNNDKLSFYALGLSSSAYVFGANIFLSTDQEWAQSYLSTEDGFDYYNSIDYQNKEDRFRIPVFFGDVQITPRTLIEYLNEPVVRYRKEVQGFKEQRPYDKVRNSIVKADRLLEKNHQTTQRLIKAFGDGAKALMNTSAHIVIQLKPIKQGRDSYVAISFRHLTSQKMIANLKEHGYLK